MIPPWAGPLAAARHLSHDRPAARFAQLSTIDGEGYPRCRTVVLRAVDEARGLVSFGTDGRSAKVAELRAAPRAEVCWYFEESREQFRLSGLVTLLAGDEPGRHEFWSTLPVTGRAGFSWPAPGTPRAEGDVFPDSDDSPTPPPTFVVGVLEVLAVDHLALRSHPHERWRHRREGDLWKSERLRP